MSCDIYVAFEVRQKDGTWTHAGPPLVELAGEIQERLEFRKERSPAEYDKTKNIPFPGKAFTDLSEWERAWQKNQGSDFHVPQNYELFSVLANVRNDEAVQPICAPKGVPSDPSPEFRWMVGYELGDGHSHSWLTLRELQNYDWKSVNRDGYFSRFLTKTLPAMATLGALDDVRMCFFFKG